MEGCFIAAVVVAGLNVASILYHDPDDMIIQSSSRGPERVGADDIGYRYLTAYLPLIAWPPRVVVAKKLQEPENHRPQVPLL